MPLRSPPSPLRHAAPWHALAVVAGASACSFTLDFAECTEDRHCADAGLVCLASACQEPPAEITVDEDITEDASWRAGTTYRLRGVRYVHPEVTLTLEAGVRVIGEGDAALVVSRGGRLEARGTRENPVVFTSARPEGSRAPGDWGGLSLLGYAPVNAPSTVLEGIDDSDLARYGGDDSTWKCGVLQYTRIEFAGRALAKDEELNGLTLAGCGSDTIVDHVQVHAGLDDGLELFGGTVDLRHVVITDAEDDALDWQLGWRGTAQFVAIRQAPTGENGIEADNFEKDHEAAPRSQPTLYNLTILGQGAAGNRGILLRRGTAGEISDLLMVGQGLEAIDVRDASTVARIDDGELRVRASLFYAVGEGGADFFPTIEDETEIDPDDGRDDDAGFDEDAFFRDPHNQNLFGADPGLGDLLGDAPPWVPTAAAVVKDGAIAPPPSKGSASFDSGAVYIGAFAPDAEPWTARWTAYPRS